VEAQDISSNNVGTDTTIFYDPSNNFYAAEAPTTTPLVAGSTTTGGIFTLTLPSAPSSDTILYDIVYNSTYFQGYIDVTTEPPGVPEPASFGLVALGLGVGFAWQRRQSRVRR
jgi:hypothetical protein